MLLSGMRAQSARVDQSLRFRYRVGGRNAAASAVVAMLLLTGCGSSGTTNPPVVVEPTGSTPSAASPTSAASPAGSASPSAATGIPSVKPVPAESNPPGDIPDNIAFVTYRNKPGGYSFTHPEGWAETGSGTAVTFTDKLNGVAADVVPATQAPTLESARTADLPRLRSSVPAFELRGVDAVSLPAGKGV